MKFHIAKHQIVRPFAGILLMAAAFAATSCTDTLDIFGSGSHDGEQKTATFEIEISPAAAVERTRAANSEDVAWDVTAVKTVWIGVFDNETGELIGGGKQEIINENPVPDTPAAEGDKVLEHGPVLTDKVKVSVMYNDNDLPKAVKVAGVANYSGIKAYKDDGTEDTLDNLLDNIKNWEDYVSISTDTESAEKMAQENECRIMSNLVTFDGNFNDDGNLKTSSHYNYMADDYKGGINLAKPGATNTPYLYTNLSDYSATPIKGHLHLRRMISHNIVNITAGENIELSGIQYKVCNLPKRTYVQDRTLKTDYTPWANAADYQKSDNSLYANDMDFTVDGVATVDGVTTFEFSHYDNKHWGLEKCQQYEDREKRNADDGSFASLSSSKDDFNNNATYFVIKARVKDKSTGMEGVVDYLIHEGYCNDEVGQPSSSNNALDFSCFRNTKYTYDVKITGLNNVLVKVYAEDGNTNPDAQPSATGNLWQVYEHDLSSNEKTFPILLSNSGDLKWYIHKTGPKGSVDFGSLDKDEWEDLREAKLSSVWESEKWENTIPNNDQFYNGIKIETESLEGFNLTDAGEYEITIPANNEPDDYNERILYIYSSYSDGTTSYQPIYVFRQSTNNLDEVTVTFNDANGDESTVGAYIIGTNIKFSWDSKEGINYTIKIDGIDGKDIDIVNNTSSNSVEIVYDNTKSYFTEGEHIITITAQNEDGQTSVTTAKYVICKETYEWNFASPDWASIMSQLNSREDDKYNETGNGGSDKRGILNFNAEKDGLHVVAGADQRIRGKVDGVVPYIQTTGVGNKSSQVLWFTAYTSGTLTIYASNTKKKADNPDPRYITVQTGDGDDPQKQEQIGPFDDNKNPEEGSPVSIKINTPTNIYIYPNNDPTIGNVVRYYKVRFEAD